MSTNLSYLMPVNPRGFFSNVTRRGHRLPLLEKLPFEWGRWDVFKREQEVCDTAVVDHVVGLHDGQLVETR
jgi:hypothetical protein